MNIHFEGQLTKRDVLDISRLGWKPNPWLGAAFYILILMLMLDYLITAFKGDIVALVILVFLLIVLSYQLWYPYLSANSLPRRDKSLLNKIQGTITEDNLNFQTIISTSTVNWDYFTRIKRSREVILLYHANGPAFSFLSRVFFSETAWGELNQYIEQRIQDGKLTDIIKTITIIFFGRRLGKTGMIVYLVALGIPYAIILLALAMAIIKDISGG